MSGNLVKLVIRCFAVWCLHFEDKRRTSYDIILQNKTSDAISYGASNESEE